MGYRKSCVRGNNPPLVLRCKTPYPMKKLIEANPRVCPGKLSGTGILAWLIVVPRFIHPKLIYPMAKMLVLFLVKYVHGDCSGSGFIYSHLVLVSRHVSLAMHPKSWCFMWLACNKMLWIVVNTSMHAYWSETGLKPLRPVVRCEHRPNKWINSNEEKSKNCSAYLITFFAFKCCSHQGT